MHRFALVTTLALSAATTAFAQTPPPASAFGRLPAIQDADISPNGQRIIMLGGAPARRAVTIATVDSSKLDAVELGDAEVTSVSWASDDRAVLRVRYWKELGPKQSYHFVRSVVIDAEGKAVSQLLANDGPQSYSLYQPIVGIAEAPNLAAMIIAPDWNMAAPGLETRIRTDAETAAIKLALWRVDLETGKGRVEEGGSTDVFDWSVDKEGKARVRQEFDAANRRWRLFARAKGSAAWKLLLEGKNEEDGVGYLGYSDHDDSIYLLSPAPGGRKIIVRRKLSDGSTEQLATSPIGGDLLWDEDRPVGITSGFGAPKTEWLDPELRSVDEGLTKALREPPEFWNWSKDRQRFLLRVSAPDQPGQWYLYDKARRELSPLGDEYPELTGVPLGRTSTITYEARDGLKIPAYVTLPPDASAGQRRPLVVLPHAAFNGSNGHDFDWIAHFIASRGYVVLRPQFRGSAGLGEEFEEAGRKEWGGKIQTDLLDGIAHLAEQGVVDPSRVCIVGSNFGGYSALAGATLHPRAYRCAASINGISDLPTMLGETIQRYGEDSGSLRYWQEVMGDPSVDAELLKATSPARRVTDATPPILLVVSDHNTTVSPKQSERMRTALDDAGRPVEYVTLAKQGHYLSTSSARTRMLEALGDFLAAHLPVGP